MQGLICQRSLLVGVQRRLDSAVRWMCQATISSQEERPDYITQPKPAYTLPFYGATDEELNQLSDNTARLALKSYGGLIRKTDEIDQLRERLRALTNASHRPSLLTIEGVVVSDKMNKSVVVAARRHAYSSKLQKAYLKTRRFMAHDELDLCREGDRVIIRSCRHMSKRKSYVVVKNFGDKTRVEEDDRKIVLEDLE